MVLVVGVIVSLTASVTQGIGVYQSGASVYHLHVCCVFGTGDSGVCQEIPVVSSVGLYDVAALELNCVLRVFFC